MMERYTSQQRVDLCLKIVKNFIERLDFCKRVRGGHAKEIEFHSHNGIERTFTAIKNFIDIQNRFCFIWKNFCGALIEKPFTINSIACYCDISIHALFFKFFFTFFNRWTNVILLELNNFIFDVCSKDMQQNKHQFNINAIFVCYYVWAIFLAVGLPFVIIFVDSACYCSKSSTELNHSPLCLEYNSFGIAVQ